MRGERKLSRISVVNTHRRIFIDKKGVRRLTRKILRQLGLSIEVHLVFVSDSRIRRLNRIFHGRDRVTDVLAFRPPAGWPFRKKRIPMLGEIIISTERTRAHAKRFGVSPSEELIRYVAHGVLHLLGERDLKVGERRRMFGKQEKLLAGLGPIPKLMN